MPYFVSSSSICVEVSGGSSHPIQSTGTTSRSYFRWMNIAPFSRPPCCIVMSRAYCSCRTRCMSTALLRIRGATTPPQWRRAIEPAGTDSVRCQRRGHEACEGRTQTRRWPANAGSRLKLDAVLGRPRPKGQPSSRTGENSPYGMIGGIEETSASFEARSAPRSYPTGAARSHQIAVGLTDASTRVALDFAQRKLGRTARGFFCGRA